MDLSAALWVFSLASILHCPEQRQGRGFFFGTVTTEIMKLGITRYAALFKHCISSLFFIMHLLHLGIGNSSIVSRTSLLKDFPPFFIEIFSENLEEKAAIVAGRILNCLWINL
jgi:hypothetical protein